MKPFLTTDHLRCAVSIATHNRRKELEITCNALAALVPAPDEVWIVADGCTDDTVAYVRERFPWFRLIEHQQSQGHVRSRDEIVRSTQCDIILVLDDDSHPVEKDFIARLKQLFAWRPQLAVASLAQQTDEFPETLEQTDFGPPAFLGNYSNASAALRRSTYLEIGGYDLDFYHAYDEVDYALRVIAAGHEIYRPTNLTIRHRFSSLNRDEVRMHHLHARYEQASLWRRCPFPYAPLVSLFRAARQAQYALRRGWLSREPEWWTQAISDFSKNWRARRPIRWKAYQMWLRLMRRPVFGEAAWNRMQRRAGFQNRTVTEMDMPRLAIAATNPCHLYPMACELARQGALDVYYSGYPAWRLPGSDGLPLATHSARTLAVYGALKFLPHWARPKSETMFRWQDTAFDRWVSMQLKQPDFVHGLPGQCLKIFRRAKDKGIGTVLNHATGPVQNLLRVLKSEYEREGLNVEELSFLDETVQKQQKEETRLADYHCVASTLVKEQLVGEGIAADKIEVIPYGADQDVFYPRRGSGPKEFRIVYAGQYTLRKGLRFLLEALELAGDVDWRLDCYGPQFDGQLPDLKSGQHHCPVEFHSALPASQLAQVFRESSVLVLPSLEEGFGLVVVQALNCGIPCLVSDKVGARDLIVHRENGSIFAAGDGKALAEELIWWSARRKTLGAIYPWEYPAAQLIEWSQRVLNK